MPNDNVLTGEQLVNLRRYLNFGYGVMTDDERKDADAILALLAAHPGQPEPRAEMTWWQPIATVVKSNAGPYLLINGQRIFSWLGTMYNDEADRIATVINDAARTGASS